MNDYKLIIPACFLVISISLINSCSSDKSSRRQSGVESKDCGILRVDDNGRYFIFNDGTPYIPIGLNKFLYLENDSSIDSLMNIWSKYGINYVRFWVGIGADPEIEVGRFDEKQMHILDHIIQCGKKYGIYLNVCFWNDNCIREQDGEWGWNGSEQIYNKENSDLGTTTNADDLKDTLHESSWNAMKNRFAYFVDRWNDEDGIIMWDLVNDGKKTDAWKKGMYDFVKKRDESDRIVTFQYNTGKDPKGEMDCGSVRVYNYNPEGNDPELMMLVLADRIKQALEHGDPVYCGEGRMDYENGSEYALERGFLHFLWAPMAVGAAGNLHSWISIRSSKERWPDLSEKELDWVKCYSDFCKTINWPEFNSRNVNEEIESDQPNIKVFACGSNDEMLLYLMNHDSTDIFDPVRPTIMISTKFKSGKYQIKWIDIRTGEDLDTEIIESFPVDLKVPQFRDGMFAHIKRK
ncbi:hypothetical protein ACFLU5_15120 [Bacteroidota bacterium]